MSAATSDPFGLVGTMLAGKYRIERVLGEGGFGIVYGATQAVLNERVAIKLIKPAASGNTAVTAASFLREARLLFGLTHPGIVRMYDVGDVKTPFGDAPYVVLEILEGRSLDEEIERRRRGEAPPFTADQLRMIFEPALDALAFAHARHVVHRDIKPSNIMVLASPDGALSAKLLDFGMAALAPSGTATSGGGLTPLYAAPEQWNAAHGSVGPATDVFAMGLCFEEAATLRPAVDGTSLPEIVHACTSPSRTSRIEQLRPDLPRALASLVVRATRVPPPERFASAQAMLDTLRASMIAQSGGARGSSLSPQSYGAPSGINPYAMSGMGPAPMPALTPPPPIGPSLHAPHASAGPHAPSQMPAIGPLPPPYVPSAPPLPTSSTTTMAARPNDTGSGKTGWIVALVLGAILLVVLVVGSVGAYVALRTADAPPAPTAQATTPPSTRPITPAVTPVTPTAPTASTPRQARPNPSPSPTPNPNPSPTPSPTPNPNPSPTPSPTPNPPPSPEAKLVFYGMAGTYGGLYPDAAEFISVVNGHVGDLKACFENEHLTEPWSVSLKVTFRTGGGRGIAGTSINRKGVPDSSIVAERLKDCIYNRVLGWPFPNLKGDPGFTGTPYVAVLSGLENKR